ncbi:MAG: DNA-directed RNA polymerase subunit P [Thermoprotei archaeon]|nr:MAG: DNA-directed RNA polymerase subunit P [Thermoprotei archaeon]
MSQGERIYRCLKCGRIFSREEMETLPGVRCPYCGHKVIIKIRPPIAKRVKAV